MLPQHERLTRASLFSRAYTTRKSVVTPYLTLYVLPKTNRPGHKPSGLPQRQSLEKPGSMPQEPSSLLHRPSSDRQSPEKSSALPNRPSFDQSVAASQIPKESTRNGAATQAIAKMPLVRMPLVGFVIAKKVCKSACQRNRAKRRVREAYRLMRKDMVESSQRLEQWYALVFVLNNKALEASWEDIRETVAGCLKKADARFGQGTNRERKPS